ncbi:MAG: cadherin-like beta sandwich domain-containing protein [Clostridium sp.]|uniref:cadherin-like beta sandwich domain-containing protein n=1 Tax=Clostridium sp. TaxID=1506 RepID=UPI0025C5AD28|nr:cadherin-like beta sandwich domain-containing protein [Clostridium sp.]MCE5221768.1 cadherin-like beta sandwich domain-containing protein [Clostridium sp.]
MNKNLKKIIAIALVIGTVSAVAPATHANLLTTKAYASENDETTLDSLQLKSSTGNTIKLYSDSDYSSDSRLDKDDTPDEDTYYAKTSSSTVNIDIDGPSSKYVKVFKGTSDNTKGKSISSDISISGDTTLTVRVYDDEPGSSVEYDDDNDDANIESEYEIKIEYTGSDSSDENSNSTDASDYDDIYLDRLSVNGESITLSDSKVAYTYNVASDVDEVTIKAVPEDEDEDTVTIDGSDVDDSDSYKKSVDLDKGANKFEIEIQDNDDNDRIYTLTINRGGSSSIGTGTATNVSTVKASQWVLVNGRWQYNDATGNPVKNSWFYDRNYGKTYFLQSDGYMATGWFSYNGAWYYLGTDGGMRTGWIMDGSKYYYLYADGSMACNTIIGGFKVGFDGAWIR